VEDLLLPDGQGWNEQKLRATFFEVDVSDILKIPIGRAGTDDYIAWNYTKNGMFSVRSAYHLKTQLNSILFFFLRGAQFYPNWEAKLLYV
jgi:hypothetical protein